MSVTQTKFNCLTQDLARRVHNLHTDTLKCMLSNSAPNTSTGAVKADITEITAEHGYSAGGAAITSQDATQTAGVLALTGTGPTITASGGTVGPFRYVIVYNATPTVGNLISVLDYGSSITLSDGQPFAISFPSDILTIT